MKALISFVAMASLTLGGLGVAGCESTNTSPQRDHNELFGVGSGEFGTTTTIAGDYPSDLHHKPATPPASNSH